MLVNRSMPPCTVIPVLAYEDVGEAVDWLCETFGFMERWRAGNHRAQLSFGHSVMVRVEDANRHHEHARQRGARMDVLPVDRRRRS